MLFAANPDFQNMPSAAGTLRVLAATMIRGEPVDIVPDGEFPEYTTILHRDDAVSVTLGVSGDESVTPAASVIQWNESLAGQTLEIQIYNPDYPTLGQVLLRTSFLPAGLRRTSDGRSSYAVFPAAGFDDKLAFAMGSPPVLRATA